ncbi:MAG: PAS domain S-box protein, partial [Pseudomonadota bacterium]
MTASEEVMETALLRFMANHTPATICLKDPEGRYLFVNKRFQELYSPNGEYLVGKTPHDLFPKHIADRFVEHDLKVLESGQSMTRENTVPTADGERTIVVTTFPIRLSGGEKALGLIGTDITEERRAREKIEQAERQEQATREWLLGALNNMSEALVIYGPDRRLILCNEQFRQLYGYTTDQTKPGTAEQDLIDLDLERGLITLSEQQKHYQNRRYQSDGEERSLEIKLNDGRWLQVRDRPIPSGGTISVQSDITAKKVLEADLKAAKEATEEEVVRQRDELILSEQRMRAIVEDQTEMISRLDTEFHVTFANMAYRRAFSETPDGEDVIGRCILDGIVDETVRKKFVENIQTLSPDNPIVRSELLEKSADGTLQWQAWTDRALFSDDGELTGYQSVGTDITGRKIAEQALSESSRERQAVIAGSKDAIITFDADGYIREFNPAAERIFRVSKEDALGRQVGQFAVPDVPFEDIHHALEHYLGSEFGDSYMNQRVELDLRRADGDIFPAEATIVVPEGYTGRDWRPKVIPSLGYVQDMSEPPLELFIGYFRDLSEIRAMEARMETQRKAIAQNEKMGALGSLLANVAHELNNPLAVVIGQADLLYELAEDEKLKKRSERIKAAANRCAGIVKTFLSAVRQREPENQLFQPDKPVRESEKLLEYGFRTSGVDLLINVEEQLPLVLGDVTQIGQVLTNLLINSQQAVEQIEGDKTVAVSVTRQDNGNTICYSIEDSGSGIPEEKRDKIFEPFFTTKQEGTGTGIGLAIVRNILTAHNGHISVTDSDLLGGARFDVELPAASVSRSQGVPEPSSGEIRKGPRARVLIVDDEEDVADIAADHLVLRGFECKTAIGGEQAFEIIANESFDAIISDLRMPGLDGPSLLERAEDEWPGIRAKFGFFTGDSLNEGARRFLEREGVLS